MFRVGGQNPIERGCKMPSHNISSIKDVNRSCQWSTHVIYSVVASTLGHGPLQPFY